jgi:hypothetical protein
VPTLTIGNWRLVARVGYNVRLYLHYTVRNNTRDLEIKLQYISPYVLIHNVLIRYMISDDEVGDKKVSLIAKHCDYLLYHQGLLSSPHERSLETQCINDTS